MIPPVSQKVTEEEKQGAIAYAHWLRDYYSDKTPGPKELDSWILYRWVLELKASLAEEL